MTHKSVKGWLWEQVISFPLKPLEGLEGVGKVIEHKANLQLQVWQHVVGQGRGWRKVTMVLPPAFSFRRRQTGRETCWLLLDYFFHPVVFVSESWWTSVPWLSTRRSTFIVLLMYSGGASWNCCRQGQQRETYYTGWAWRAQNGCAGMPSWLSKNHLKNTQ